MILISPVIAEITDAELITIQRALERWSGMDDKLAQLIGAVAETGSTFTLAIKGPAPTTADTVQLLRRCEDLAYHLDKLRHGLKDLQRQQRILAAGTDAGEAA